MASIAIVSPQALVEPLSSEMGPAGLCHRSRVGLEAMVARPKRSPDYVDLADLSDSKAAIRFSTQSRSSGALELYLSTGRKSGLERT